MRNLILIVLILFIPFWCGCVRYSYDQYQLKVIDAEDGGAVEGAKAYASYIMHFAPPRIEAITDHRGFAELMIAGSQWNLNVNADGYVPLVGFPLWRDIAYQQDIIIHNGTEVLVAIYKKPAPEIEIIVPDGYRGPIELEIMSTNKLIQGKAVKRVISSKMRPDGTVKIQGSPIFFSIPDENITVRYESGNVLPLIRYQDDPDTFGLILSGNKDLTWKLFIGTRNNVWDSILSRVNQSP